MFDPLLEVIIHKENGIIVFQYLIELKNNLRIEKN